MKLGKLTVRHLRAARACQSQVRRFKEIFPHGFVPSKENFILAADSDLSVTWAADRFLDQETYEVIYAESYSRRWGAQRKGFSETLNYTFAVCWWNLIQQELTA